MKTKAIFIILSGYALLLIFSVFYFNGTGNSGDSISHYLYARYAPLHPSLFFNQWAKPVFILMSCPFAQAGFAGIKIFNSLVAAATIYLTFKISGKLNIKNSILVSVFLIFSPLYFAITLSGFTEPLFALFICVGIYLVLKNKYILSAVVISFLPFVRSEGIILILVFGLFFTSKRKWKALSFLLAGHIIYSLAGYFIYHDFLWVFNRIPYARLSSNYGSGKLFHFAEQLIYVVGVPLYVLFWIGLLILIIRAVKGSLSPEFKILVLVGFLAYFIAHSLFWYLGIFNSMGLKRVLIGILPLIAIISLSGLNFLTELLFQSNTKIQNGFKGLLTIYIVIFPFSSNPAALNLKKDLCRSTDEELTLQVNSFLKKNVNGEHRYIFSNPYLSEALHLDPFDENVHAELTKEIISQVKRGDIIIWENWYAPVENGITQNILDENKNLMNIGNFNAVEYGHEIKYEIYSFKNTTATKETDI